MIDPQQVQEAKRTLGAKLAERRNLRGLTQADLAARVHSTRSTVAGVERGDQVVDRVFWQRCETLLGAGGELLAGYDEYRRLKQRHDEEKVDAGQRARWGEADRDARETRVIASAATVRHGGVMMTAEWYRRFAVREARGHSPTYEALALAVSADEHLVKLLDQLPQEKRQPNLLFAAAQYLGAPVATPDAFSAWAVQDWPELSGTMRSRRTQTNEPTRCATMLPILAQLPQPLALLEVGASAGLCLYPDAYQYQYGDGPIVLGPADSQVRLSCAISGNVPIPESMPAVVWRAGLDLNPLDVASDDDVRWLDALIWPEQQERRDRLHAAVRIARADPPHLVTGDLLADLPALVAQAPADATLVIFHSAVLTYVPPETRTAFTDLVRGLPCRWISNEGTGVLPELASAVKLDPDGPAMFLLALDGQPLGLASPHGQEVRWLTTHGASV
ncbi:hypothetical protein Jiend_30030 [Micromonospora endophytica]|nr:hypothetical protein Jiend_30030 [Micromonospora endophytica]